MAAITRRGTSYTPIAPSALTLNPPSWAALAIEPHQFIAGKLAGEDLLPCQPIYLKSDGLLYKTPANHFAKWDGWAWNQTQSGQACTLILPNSGLVISYADASTFTIGDKVYLDPAVAGGLNTAPGMIGVNDVQTLTNNGDAGTYVLGYPTLLTSALAFGALAATVQTALEVIFGTGNVTVSGTLAGGFTITFVGDLAGKPMPTLTFTNSMTFMSGSTTGGIVHTTPGYSRSAPVGKAINDTSFLLLPKAAGY